MAQRAVELSAELPARIHGPYSHYYFNVERDYEGAMEESLQTIQLEPNNMIARASIGYALRRMGRFE